VKTACYHVQDLSPEAFSSYLKGVKAENTVRKYTTYTKRFLQLMRSNGYREFSEIPPGLLNEFASMLTREGKSASTVRVQVYAVKKYLEWVRGRGVDVPSQGKPDLPRKKVRVRPVLPANLFTAYFREADLVLEEPVRTAVMLLPCSGLRASEMVSLRLAHIQKARVKLQTTDRKGNALYKTTLFLRVRGKGDKDRHVPLMDEGVEILTGYLAGWRRRQPGVWLFPRLTHKPSTSGKKHITDRTLRDGVQRLREGLKMDFTPHTMRRTYITTLWRKKVDLGTIARIAGHANVQTTIDHYLAMEPSDAINALHAAGSSLTEA
jgi:integrase/recombinase XerD